MDDRELLREYVERQSEMAFAELVTRHVNLVYATALRILGESQMAQDVAQTVFIRLARKARSVREGNALPGWLYHAACGAARDVLRREGRRRRRETEAMNRAQLERDSQSTWEAILPLLDEAMQQLNRFELDAVVLRFLEGKSFRETGLALAVSEDAAQKRVSRALDKLRTHFAKRGLILSAAAIVTALETNSLQSAPLALTAGLAGTSLSGAAGSMGLGTLIQTVFMTNAKTAIAVAALACAISTPLILQHQTIRQLRQEQTQSARQLADMAKLREENDRLNGQLQEQLRAQKDELLRLRAQAAALRQAEQDNARLKAEQDRANSSAKNSTAQPVYPTAPRLGVMLAEARAAQGEVKGPIRLPVDANLQFQYGNLFQKLNLTTDQIAAFKKIQEDKQPQIAAAVREHPFDPANARGNTPANAAAREQYQAEIEALMQPIEQAADSQIKQLLGSDDYNYYRTYTDQQKERMVVMGGYREGLDAAGVPPLTLDQVEQLVSVAYQHRTNSGQDPSNISQSMPEVLQQAGTFLTADQVLVLGHYTAALASPSRMAVGQ
jgi:RNA polymerase sigma factor (sigma-70 family)